MHIRHRCMQLTCKADVLFCTALLQCRLITGNVSTVDKWLMASLTSCATQQEIITAIKRMAANVG